MAVENTFWSAQKTFWHPTISKSCHRKGQATGLDGKGTDQYVSGAIAALQKAETEAIA